MNGKVKVRVRPGLTLGLVLLSPCAAPAQQSPDVQVHFRTAQRYARELRWLSGDPSTHVKLSLFLHAKEFYPFGVDVSDGLWVARNRALVVSTLEQAMRDPQQPIEPVGSLLHTAVALKARLESPFNPVNSTNPLPHAKQIEGEYIRCIAATLPLRRGENPSTVPG
jgi:hypothetical protein